MCLFQIFFIFPHLLFSSPLLYLFIHFFNTAFMIDGPISQSEHSVVIGLSISRLPQVFLKVDWFRYSEDRRPIGWPFTRLQLPNQLWHGDALLGVPVGARPDNGVPEEESQTPVKLSTNIFHFKMYALSVQS